MRILNSFVRAAVLAVALLAVAGRSARAQYQVIVNSANGAESVSKDDLSKIFLKKANKWPDGKQAVAIDLDKGSPVRDAFSKAVHGRAASAVVSYWQQQIFSGADTPPAEKGSDADILAFVKGNPGAVGYVSSGADVSGVRVVAVK